MNVENFVVSLGTAFVYALIGWAASKEAFNWKKFVATLAIQTVGALGLGLTGLDVDVYVSAVAPTTITVFVQKIWNAVTKKKE